MTNTEEREVSGEPCFGALLEVDTPSPAGFLAHLADIMADYVPPGREAGAPIDLAFYGAKARIEARARGLLATARSPDRGALASMKYMIAWNLREFLGEETQIVWSGEGADTPELPQFREMRVVDAWQVSPTMQRVRLTGHDLARFRSGGLHVQLLIPPAGREPVWPKAAPSGIPAWPDGDDRLTSRTYTIRNLDAGAGFVDIDIVLHEGSSPGSDWARHARPGECVGMMGPGGGGVLPAPRMLMAGDETALPAIARMLAELPRDARGSALIEIDSAAERQEIDVPAGFDLVWLERNGRPAGTTTLLEDAITALDWPGAGEATVWVGCEFQAFKRLRHHCRKVWRLKGREHLVVAYWRRTVETA